MNYVKAPFSDQKISRLSRVKDVKFSVQKDYGSSKNKRSVSVDSRSRGSYIPERRRPSSEERKSGNSGYLRWSGARKSSIISDVKRCVKDTRPLQDKVYQKKKIIEIIEFLKDLEFKYPLTVDKLMSPSKKDFEVIFQFLYNYFDPSYEVKRLEEEAPKIIKSLGYPFNVNKSAFVCVTRTNWSSLLGILIWLLDLNKFVSKINFEDLFEDETNDKAQIHAILLKYLIRRHHERNVNEEDDDRVDDAFFAELIMNSIEDEEALVVQNEEKKKRLEAVEREIAEIKALSDEKAKLEEEIKKYDEYFANMKIHYQKKNAVYLQTVEQLKIKESELQQLENEIATKQAAYDAQGFDGKKHLAFCESQKKELVEKLETKQNQFKELQDKLWECEMQQSQNLEQLKTVADSFNELYDSIVNDAKNILQPLEQVNHAQLQKLAANFYLEFPDIVMKPNKPDWTTFKAPLDSIDDKISRTNEMLKSIAFKQDQKVLELQTKQTEVEAQVKALSFKNSQTKHDYDLQIKEALDEGKKLEAQCKQADEQLKTLREEKLKLTSLKKEMTDELEILKKYEEDKKEEFNKYLEKKKKAFQYFACMEKKVAELKEDLGNDIFENLIQFEKQLNEVA